MLSPVDVFYVWRNKFPAIMAQEVDGGQHTILTSNFGKFTTATISQQNPFSAIFGGKISSI